MFDKIHIKSFKSLQDLELELDGLDLISDQTRLFMVDRDIDGLTVVNRLRITDELVKLARERDVALNQLWMEGYFGGVPNV